LFKYVSNIAASVEEQSLKFTISEQIIYLYQMQLIEQNNIAASAAQLANCFFLIVCLFACFNQSY